MVYGIQHMHYGYGYFAEGIILGSPAGPPQTMDVGSSLKGPESLHQKFKLN
jgi:hypothetical protein